MDPNSDERGPQMRLATRRIRLALAAVAASILLTVSHAPARAGEEGPPVPDPGTCCTLNSDFDALLQGVLDLGAGACALLY